MKRKVISILFALVLVLSFSLVTAVPAAAVATTHTVAPFTLDGTGDNTAAWSTVQEGTGSSSVLLTYVDGDNSYVEFAPATGTTVDDLATITDTSWWYYASAAYGPILELRFTSGSGHVDITVDTAEVSPAITTGTTEEVTSASTCIYFGNDPDDQTSFSNNTGSVTLAGVLASINAQQAMIDDSDTADAWELTRVRVEIGWSAPARTCYIDDIEIAGVTYALEEPDFTTIGAAITAASEDDIISVAAGTYTENVAVNKSLTLTGASSATVTVDAADAAVSVFTVTANDVTISGFTATGCTGPWAADDLYAGIRFPAHVENCNIHDNILTGNIVGILMLDTEDTTTTGNNTFTSNNASNNIVSGIEMQHTYGNTFSSNTASSGVYGFNLDSARNNIFTGNIANSNTKYGFFLAQGGGAVGSSNNTFTNNTANSNTRSGIRMTNLSGPSTYTGNTFDSNVIAGMELGGTASDNISNLTVNSNSFSGNPISVKIDDNAIITSVVLRNNNIVGNTSYGVSVSSVGVTGTVDALNNWWDNASGPELFTPLVSGYESYGNKVSANVSYEPWLLAEVVSEVTPTTFEKTLALRDGWTLVSTDQEVGSGTTWVETEIAYKYTGTAFTQVDLATQLTPVDAYYVKTVDGGGVGINYSTDQPGVVTKGLVEGWNLIGCTGANLGEEEDLSDAYTILSQLRHVQIGEQQGVGLTSLVGQASYNQFLPDPLSLSLVTEGDWTAIDPEGVPIPLHAFDGFWVYMNAAKSFGVIPD